MPTGHSLRVARVRARLRQQDIADVLGSSRSRVSQIESLERVPPAWVQRYKGALTAALDRTERVGSEGQDSVD